MQDSDFKHLMFKPNWTYMPTAGNTLPIRLRTRQTFLDPPSAPALTPFALPQGDISSPSKHRGKSPTGSGNLAHRQFAIVKKSSNVRTLEASAERSCGKYRDLYLSIQAENLQAAESRISDVDVAILEMTQFVRNQILTSPAVAMLGQANSYPHMLMNLMNGWS